MSTHNYSVHCRQSIEGKLCVHDEIMIREKFTEYFFFCFLNILLPGKLLHIKYINLFFFSFANKTYLLRCQRFHSSSCNFTSITHTHTKQSIGEAKKVYIKLILKTNLEFSRKVQIKLSNCFMLLWFCSWNMINDVWEIIQNI